MGSDPRKVFFNKRRLKLVMKRRRIKQANLALLLDRDINTIKGAFRDEKMLPEHLDKICKYLNVDIAYILDPIISPDPVPEEFPQYKKLSAFQIDQLTNVPLHKFIAWMYSAGLEQKLFYRCIELGLSVEDAEDATDLLCFHAETEADYYSDVIIENFMDNLIKTYLE